MTILQRYVLREMIGPLGLGLLVFTFVFLIGQVFRLTDLLLNSSVPGQLAGELIVLLLPGILSITIPMAVLVAILLGIGRLAADREILAIRASGVNLLHITVPLVGLATVLTALMMFFNQRAIPYLNQKSSDVRLQLEFYIVSAIPPATPMALPTSSGNTTTFFYTSRNEETGVMEGVTMQTAMKPSVFTANGETTLTEAEQRRREELKKRAAKMSREEIEAYRQKMRMEREAARLTKAETEVLNEALILAQEAQIVPDMDQRVLNFNLTSGSIHFANPEQPSSYDIVRFEALSKGYIPEFSRTEDGVYVKDVREMSVRELREAMKANPRKKKYAAELYQRFSIPLACIAFALIAIPLGVFARPTGKAIAFTISFLLILLYYGLLQYGVSVVGNSHSFWGPFAVFFPNVLLGTVGLVLLYRMVRK